MFIDLDVLVSRRCVHGERRDVFKQTYPQV